MTTPAPSLAENMPPLPPRKRTRRKRAIKAAAPVVESKPELEFLSSREATVRALVDFLRSL